MLQGYFYIPGTWALFIVWCYQMRIVSLLRITLKICTGGCLFENILVRVNRPNKIKINGYAVLNLNSHALIKDSKLDFYGYILMCCWYFMALTMWQTMYKSSDPALELAAGLSTFNPQLKLNCLPLWIVLQSLGHDGIVDRIKHCCNLVIVLPKYWAML